MQAHGIVDRPSKDLDAYTASLDPEEFARAEHSLVDALRSEGLDASVESSDSWFRQITVTDPATAEIVSVDLGYDYRQHPPATIHGIGPVLDVEDVVLGKLRALSDRQAERDFVDLDAILANGRWTVVELYRRLATIRPEMTTQDFQALLRSAHLADPVVYAALGLTESDVTALIARLNRQADQLERDPHRGPARPQ